MVVAAVGFCCCCFTAVANVVDVVDVAVVAVSIDIELLLC